MEEQMLSTGRKYVACSSTWPSSARRKNFAAASRVAPGGCRVASVSDAAVSVATLRSLAQERIAIVERRRERLLDRTRRHPANQVPDRARLVVGARSAAAAERLLTDHCAGRLVVDVE